MLLSVISTSTSSLEVWFLAESLQMEDEVPEVRPLRGSSSHSDVLLNLAASLQTG
jgi:hypothetical protein